MELYRHGFFITVCILFGVAVFLYFYYQKLSVQAKLYIAELEKNRIQRYLKAFINEAVVSDEQQYRNAVINAVDLLHEDYGIILQSINVEKRCFTVYFTKRNRCITIYNHRNDIQLEYHEKP